MESGKALRYLSVSRVHAALAAASPSLGHPSSLFYRRISTIIPDPPETLHETLSEISFTPSNLLSNHANLSLSSVSNLSLLVNYLVDNMTTSPEAMHLFVTILQPQIDPMSNSAYERSSTVSLFLRKCVVAFSSLSFTAIAHLRDHLRDPPSMKKKPAIINVFQSRDASLSLHNLHKQFDTTHLKASVALAIYHISHGYPAEHALEECLRYAQESNDNEAQTQILEWMAYVQKGQQKRNLLAHNHIAVYRENLLGLDPNNRYAVLSVGTFDPNVLVLKARAWLSKASIPTAVVLAKSAFKRAKKDNRIVCGVALANLVLLQGRWSEAMQIFELLEENMLLESTRNWILLKRYLRRGELHFARVCVDKAQAFVQCADRTQVDVEELEMDALEAKIMWCLRAEDFRKAAKLCEGLKRRAAVLQRPERCIEAVRLEAECLLHAGSPDKALYCALSSITLARGMDLERLRVRCICTLVECILSLDEACTGVRGMNALEEIFSRGVEGCGIRVQAWITRLWAECQAKDNRENGLPATDDTIEMLINANNLYESIEDMWGSRHCLLVLAQIYDEREMISLRDSTSKRLYQLDETLLQRQTAYP